MFKLTPAEIGLPPKFQEWRPGQWESAYTTFTTTKRFIAAAIPTGGGKSPYCVATALLSGGRWPYVTSSKGLQDQLLDDFRTVPGFCDMRGRQNYSCVMGSSCAEGRIMECKDMMCRYNEAKADFTSASLPETNYAYYLSSMMHGDGIGHMDGLILDEAHNAVQELCNVIEIKLPHKAYDQFYGTLGSGPPINKPIAEYRTWAKWLLPQASKMLADYKRSGNKAKWLTLLDRFCSDLNRICNVPETWIVDDSSNAQTLICPLWPTEYAEQYLFAGAPKVILSSATLVPKTLSLLGIKQEDSLFLNMETSFDPRRCPIYIMPAGDNIRVEKNMPEANWQSVMGMMDTFIRRRLDRKGIIVIPSYEWMKRIYKDSEHAHLFITPWEARELAGSIEEFMKSGAPRILISPAITTGYDFKYSMCEYTILLKVPFIPPSPVMDARAAADPEYKPYLVGQTMVQAFGRGMRAANDQNEILILDGHASWFFKRPFMKGGRNVGGYRHLIPHYTVRQLQYPDGQPEPPLTLAQQGIGLAA